VKEKQKVAVLGAGPGGLVAARYLASEGFEPVIFEQSDQVGGQWHVGNDMSGIWPTMETNTSRGMTHFGDLGYPSDVPVFVPVDRVQQYLVDYIAHFHLQDCLRLGHRIHSLSRINDKEWNLCWRTADGEESSEIFSRVVVATGRFNRSWIPPVPGMDSRQGKQQGPGLRVLHSMHYKDPASFQGLRVLVAGGAISALEIACDLVKVGAASVSCSFRRQRYIVRKLHHTVPVDHYNFSLSEAFAGETLQDEILAAELKAFVLETAGSPEQFGLPKPLDDIRYAGFTKCEHYLDQVAAGEITPRSWIAGVRGKQFEFEDGSSAQYDVVIFATGFVLGIPFLDRDTKSILALDAEHIGLYKHTFHPDLPGLALQGFYNQVGPYFPILELQARYIAYQFSGRCASAAKSEMHEGIQEYFDTWSRPQKIRMHQLALLFAREIDALPDPVAWPDLTRHLLFGPLSPAVFRLTGPDALNCAAEQVRQAAAAFGMISGNRLTEQERNRLQQLGVETGC
jgi:dimethylaniline monooxygenase (N-oxide forming)